MDLDGKQPPLVHAAVETPLGWVAVLATPRGIRHITLPKPTRAQALARLEAEAGILGVKDEEALTSILERLRAYYAGHPVAFDDIPLDLEEYPAFYRAVWERLREVKRGEVITYGELARRVGKPGAARAVGRAMAANPVPPIVPCHRVIASNGRLGGYGGGLEMKARLLRMEGTHISRR